MKQIHENSTVVIHFNMYAENGSLANTTYGEKPVKFSYGDDSFSEFFEEALLGLSPGAKKVLILEPDNAFGQSNARNIQTLPIERFSNDMTPEDLEEGTVIEFKQGGEGRLYAVVKEKTDKTVTVDFNHPLAGQTLKLEVEVVDVLK